WRMSQIGGVRCRSPASAARNGSRGTLGGAGETLIAPCGPTRDWRSSERPTGPPAPVNGIRVAPPLLLGLDPGIVGEGRGGGSSSTKTAWLECSRPDKAPSIPPHASFRDRR